MDSIRPLFSLAGLAIGVAAHVPYFYNVVQGRTKPHVFTWGVWSILNGIAFAAQLSDKGGAGAWPTGLIGALCFVGVILALIYGERRITKGDWLCLLACLAALPVWLLTHDALAATLLVTVIDLVSFIPTFRKTWLRPGEETLTTFFMVALSMALGLPALENYSLTTVLFPATIVAANTVFILMAMYRRRMLAGYAGLATVAHGR